MSRASLAKPPDEVAGMFDEVAQRYDLVNDVLSVGQDRWWRYLVARTVDARPGERILDLAAGTGASSEPLTKHGAYVVPADFSLGMLRRGRQDRAMPFVAADGLRLPFADESFDAVTISFGLRNMVDVDAALAELLRVTRPFGRLVICEFSTPTFAPLRKIYLQYLVQALPGIARGISSNPESYVYLAESILQWPDQRRLAARIAGVGWGSVGWRNLSGGIVALHHATRP